MKVVVVASLAYSLINFRGALLGALVKAGHRVIACAPEDDAEIIAQLAQMGVEYRRIAMRRTGTNPLSDLVTLTGLVSLVRRERPDVLLAYTQKPIIYAGIGMRIVGRGRYFAMVSGLGHVFSPGASSALLRAIVSYLYRMAVARAEAVFVFNRDDRAEMLRHGIIDEAHRVVQVPGSGVDIARFAPQPVPAGAACFLMVARLLRDKGLCEFVEAARLLRARGAPARFLLLGPLDANPTGIKRAEVEAWHAEGLVEYLGETRDVAPILARATVFVLPSYYREGLPRTILEAMAVGRAVITTDMPGCREPIVEGVNGFLVAPRDAGALADAMERFIRDPDLATRMGAAARRTAQDHYAVEKVNAILLGTMGLDREHQPRIVPASGGIGRRAFDIVASLLGIVVLAPLALVIAALVALFLGRPILFTQTRCGRKGRPFRLRKFRTMTDARAADGSLADDAARTTPLGRFLRRFRLDELPQLLNVLKGEMSLVGPRPMLPESSLLEGDVGSVRSSMRPGLTGWAQVNGNTLLTEEDKLSLDLWYIAHASWRLDCQIALRTLLVLVRGERLNHPAIRSVYAGDARRRG
ncbi:sugar transferase [Sphingomonas cavernae]|uniref:Glycosyltransferase n=1 Tax=Sphingomonas cavernae TaxID=2320861 RepID=A0A418WR01_9SPHN|nr:sugar transferase [Sphingomonas cavernae]RJF93641.1 glycosyltransferase [Sphingomonas cavernae]